MNIRELAIGNYYKAPIEWIGSFEAKISPFGEDRYFKLTKEIFKIIVNLDIECLNWIKPIPLTEEILLKCGFEIYPLRLGSRRFYNIGNLIIEICNIDFGVYYTKHKELICFVKSLHQLQNLYFALTNEELNINL